MMNNTAKTNYAGNTQRNTDEKYINFDAFVDAYVEPEFEGEITSIFGRLSTLSFWMMIQRYQKEGLPSYIRMGSNIHDCYLESAEHVSGRIHYTALKLLKSLFWTNGHLKRRNMPLLLKVRIPKNEEGLYDLSFTLRVAEEIMDTYISRLGSVRSKYNFYR